MAGRYRCQASVLSPPLEHYSKIVRSTRAEGLGGMQ
jgi:hypothetical protein